MIDKTKLEFIRKNCNYITKYSTTDILIKMKHEEALIKLKVILNDNVDEFKELSANKLEYFCDLALQGATIEELRKAN